eukprot:CAMPEP_0171077984 /NCGR_PEP_ID=MMETSP0766_2-20121228/14369_1 /TAXON_ID=439317 /ORGANISM="Gambierdiscus australes, Strain CAWD 149" /LENGTH=953 /DNA_ID=CAMNT_0011535079 /DNA_START=67 /DNA_END=2925 /DNA_ORIENTATION=+
MRAMQRWALLLCLAPHLVTSARHAGNKHQQHQQLHATDEHQRHVAWANGTVAECRVTLRMHPNEVECPQACPFLRREPTGICEFKCVAKGECNADDPHASFADPEKMRCGPCFAIACEQCGASASTCARCHENFKLVNGECLSRYAPFWNFAYSVLGLLVTFAVVYVIILALRPMANRTILEHALRFRSSSKTRDETDGKLWPLLWTNVRNEYICGIGVILHFRWQLAIIAWSAFVLTVLGVLAMVYRKRPSLQKHGDTLDLEGFDVCNSGVQKQEADLQDLEVAYFYAILVIYLASTAASIAFAAWQRRWANMTSLRMTTMQDFVLQVKGLPKQPGSEPVETDLKDFFQEAFSEVGVEVIGVSVCWDYRKDAGRVEQTAVRDLDDDEFQWEVAVGLVYSTRTVERSPRTHFQRSLPGTIQCCGNWAFDPYMRYVDGLLGVKERRDGPEDRVSSPRELTQILEKMTASGYAYVVFNTEEQRDKALEFAERYPIRYPQGAKSWCQFELSFKTDDIEPDIVLWSNYGVGDTSVVTGICKGICYIILSVVVLDIFFYFPYVTYIMRCAEIKGTSQGELVQSTLLGLLICICNQLIYLVIGHVADSCGFKTKDSHQRFYVLAYTAAVFGNTVIDLFTVVLIAQGYSVDQALEMQIASDSVMSTQAIAENFSLQMSLYLQIWAYIFPSCLLLPFLLEPLAHLGLYFLNVWFVRSRRVSALDAEALLQCPPFDLARYGDILVNAMLCVSLCAFTYRDLWTIFGCLLVSLVWIYSYDRYRLLRLCTRSSFVSQKLSHLAQWLSALPCAILSATMAFRVHAASVHHADDPLVTIFGRVEDAGMSVFGILNRAAIVCAMLFAAIAHLVFHFAALHWLVPHFSTVECAHDMTVPYGLIASSHPCNWFNANPVFCLRSKYFYKHEQPCVQFKSGKEYLLRANPSLGQHFYREPPEEDGVRKPLM